MSENPIALLSVCGGVNTEDIEEMIQVVDDISSHALKYFLNQVFSDDAVTNIFVSGKGSANQHHAYKGGLLRHSLECIRMISRFTELPVLEREIGIVAALLHDFVKIKMYYNTPGYSAPMISHDSRTLEMLSEPLRDLEKHWFDGAGLLRMILEYPLTKKNYIYKKVHVPAVVDVVWFADQISTAIDLEKSAFAALSG